MAYPRTQDDSASNTSGFRASKKHHAGQAPRAHLHLHVHSEGVHEGEVSFSATEE